MWKDQKKIIFSHQILITGWEIGFINRDQRKYLRLRVSDRDPRGDERILLDVWDPQGKELLMKEHKSFKIAHWFVVGARGLQMSNVLSSQVLPCLWPWKLPLSAPSWCCRGSPLIRPRAKMFVTGTLGWDLLLFPTTFSVQLELFWMILLGAETPAWLHCYSPGTSVHSPFLMQH